jgi:hypothetical protein
LQSSCDTVTLLFTDVLLRISKNACHLHIFLYESYHSSLKPILLIVFTNIKLSYLRLIHSLAQHSYTSLVYYFRPSSQAIIRPAFCQEPCGQPYKNLIHLRGIEISFTLQIRHNRMLHYAVKLNEKTIVNWK